jgi:hypothetical protein
MARASRLGVAIPLEQTVTTQSISPGDKPARSIASAATFSNSARPSS